MARFASLLLLSITQGGLAGDGPFGKATIYGTPTVPVVDPANGHVLNRTSIRRWRNTNLISLPDAVAAFSIYRFGQQPVVEQPAPAAHAEALQQIKHFGSYQAERIYDAYAQPGKALARSGVKRGQQFQFEWKNLGAMRGATTDDRIRQQREAATHAGARTAPVVLNYPTNSLFTDRPL